MRGHELERGTNYVRIFTCLDLDRTILKSTTFFANYVIPHIKQYYADDGSPEVPTEIEKAVGITIDKEGRSRGMAFDFVGYFDERAKDAGYDELDIYSLARQIVDANRDKDGGIKDEFVKDILADGALELISALEEEEDGLWAFLTSGGQLTQTLKLEVVKIIIRERLGISTQARIVSTESKAKEVVEEWHDRSDDLFVVPADMVNGRHVRVEYVRIVDDKVKNTDVGRRNACSDRVVGVLMHPLECEPHHLNSRALTVRGLTRVIKSHK